MKLKRLVFRRFYDAIDSLDQRIQRLNIEVGELKTGRANLAVAHKALKHKYESETRTLRQRLETETRTLRQRYDLERQRSLSLRQSYETLERQSEFVTDPSAVDEDIMDRATLYSRVFGLEQEIEILRAYVAWQSQSNNMLCEPEIRLRLAELELARELEATPTLQDGLDDLSQFQRDNGVTASPLILVGFAKSGNTFVRFTYTNLMAVTNSEATETVTYTRLNEINRSYDFMSMLKEGRFIAPIDFDHSGFPVLLQSHNSWSPSWSKIGHIIYLTRNPLDTLISYWYNDIEFSEANSGSVDVDTYVRQNIGQWCGHYARGIAGADTIVRYENLMRNPFDAFHECLTSAGVTFEPEALERAVEMSHIDAIREMEDKTGQQKGHRVFNPNVHDTPPDPWKDGARFTRSGEIGQWDGFLKPETMDIVFSSMDMYGLRRDDIIWE